MQDKSWDGYFSFQKILNQPISSKNILTTNEYNEASLLKQSIDAKAYRVTHR